MSTHITVDPITRIEGHLRIDVEVDGGVVKKAWSSGQMFRGIERILEGRDPREAWVFTQRFCGVCTTVHAIASVRAVDWDAQRYRPTWTDFVRTMRGTVARQIGAHEARGSIAHLEVVVAPESEGPVAESAGIRVYGVRWRVLGQTLEIGRAHV